MAYAILRVGKLKTDGQLDGMQMHNDRTNDVKNANPELTKNNTNWFKNEEKTLREAVESRIEASKARTKKGNVRAIEYLVTFTPGFDEKKHNQYFTDALKWMQKRHGSENLVHFSIHRDEKTPHMHAYVVPVTKKMIKWQNGSKEKGYRTGEKEVTTLSAKDLLGGKKKMHDMQDSFHEAVKHHGLERGQKGSHARHESIQQYYSRVKEMEGVQRENERKISEGETFELQPKPFLQSEKKYIEEQQEAINAYLEQEKKKMLKDLTNHFSQVTELAAKARNEKGSLRRDIFSLSDEVSKVNEEGIASRLSQQEALKSLNKMKVNFKRLDDLAKGLYEHDREASRILGNRYQEREQKKKNKGLSRS